MLAKSKTELASTSFVYSFIFIIETTNIDFVIFTQ